MVSDPPGSPDTFISYSSADDSLVRGMEKWLRAAGANPFFAPVDIAKGEDFIDKIEAALKHSRWFLLFLSSAATGSFWVGKEWKGYLTSMKEKPDRRLLPVLLPGSDDKEIPVILGSQNYLDLRDHKFDDAMDLEVAAYEVITALKGPADGADGQPVPIPFVVCAMTATEFERLDSGAAFEDAGVAVEKEAKAAYAALKAFLAEHAAVDLAGCYDERRDAWRPPIASLTIEAIVHEVIRRHNEGNGRTPSGRPMRAQFLSDDVFSADLVTRSKVAARLAREDGWVLVIDPVSMLHPVVYARLLQSGLAAQAAASLVVVPPLSMRASPAFARLHDLESRIANQLVVAASRFDKELDLFVELGVGDIHNLKRWLYAILPEAAMRVQRQRPNRQRTAALRQRLEPQQGTPRGIQQVFYGGGAS